MNVSNTFPSCAHSPSFGYNLTEDALMEMELDDAVESRIEIISKEIKEYWDETLISCITDS